MKPKRIVLHEGIIRASLLTVWLESKEDKHVSIPLEEKALQENYHKKARLVLEVLE